MPATSNNARNKGFTLVEALVAITLLAVGVVAALGGLSALAGSEAKVRERETMQQLALDKYDELRATDQTTAATNGDFTDRNENRYQWASTITNTDVTNLTAMTVTVTKTDGDKNDTGVKVSGLIYTPPTTTTTGAGN